MSLTRYTGLRGGIFQPSSGLQALAYEPAMAGRRPFSFLSEKRMNHREDLKKRCDAFGRPL
jgi:hypothetical protein